MQTKIAEKYFFFGLLLTTLIFTFLIFRPFWIVLVLGICFSIVLYPVYKWFNLKTPNWLASLLTVVLFTIILCGPILGIGAIVFNQSQDMFHSITKSGASQPFLDRIDLAVNNALPNGVVFDVKARVSDFIAYTSSNIANIFTTTLSAFFSFILMLLIMFYFLKDGAHWRQSLIVLSPLGDENDEKIIKRLTLAVNGVIKGSLFIGLIQGILMGFGLWLFHVPNPALWGMVAAVASLLPTIGTALVSIPAIIFLLATGDSGNAIGLVLWSALGVGMIDNFLSPYIVGGSINIPPLLILFAVLGGISLLGPVGIIVGPLTVSLLYTLISIYRNEFKQIA
ncbi:MAG: AI-2E family transporter [Candidatus Pacebacteria bacterium]|nr:AI-2E family transporter [Candidatus Paceibacterota bacterium]